MSKAILGPPGQEGIFPSLQRSGDTPLRILWYDTEQSQQTTKEILVGRILRMTGTSAQETDDKTATDERLYVFNVRTFSCEERLRMFEEAVAWLRMAKARHDLIEELYRPAVDFAGVTREAELLCRELFTES